MRDRQFRAFGKDVELRIGDDRGDLEDRVFAGIEACHFQVDPDETTLVTLIGCHALALLPRFRA